MGQAPFWNILRIRGVAKKDTYMVLEGLTVMSIADDILVPDCGETEKEARVDHDRNLITVLERLEKNHVKINATKMKFLTTSATFMGHVITPDGLRPDPTTVHTVIQLPTPRDKQGDSADF